MSMTKRIAWVNEGKDSGEQGYWTSLEGRFTISPLYAGRVRPISYRIDDNLKHTKSTQFTVLDAKDWANRQICR